MKKHIMKDIDQERKKQIETWGGESNDDKLSVLDWVAIICVHAGRGIKKGRGKEGWYPPLNFFRHQMVRVAALAVAAIEAVDRKKDAIITPTRGQL